MNTSQLLDEKAAASEADGPFDFLNEPAHSLPPDWRKDSRERYEAIQREGLKTKLKHIADDTEAATDYCRRLIRAGADVSEELKELETTGNGLALVAGLLKLESERA